MQISNSLRWKEVYDNQLFANFTLVSIDYDVNNNLEVLLDSGNSLLAKLTSSHYYSGPNITWVKDEYCAGSWIKKGIENFIRYELRLEFI